MIDPTKEELQPFNPRDASYRRKLWVRVVTPDKVWHHIFWGRVMAAFLAGTIVLWAFLAGCAWAFVKFQRGYDEVSYLDLAFYPLRQEEYRTGIGRYYIKRGQEEMEKKNWREGYSLLQIGVARVPDDVTARRLLAYTQVRFGRTDLAIATLSEGTERPNTDIEYFKLLCTLLLETHEDEKLILLAKKILPPTPDTILVHQYLALQMATAHYERGRYDEAERIVADWRLERSLEGSILIAGCNWERGYPDLAMLRLDGEIARFPKRDELYLALVRYHRELGHTEEARRYALLRHFNDPTSPGPRIDMLHTYHAASDQAAETREIETYFTDFSGDARALLLLASFASDTANPALADRLVTLARERTYATAPFMLTKAQALIAVQNYAAALEVTQQALSNAVEPKDYVTSALSGIRCLALFGLRETSRAELMLNAFLSQANLRASDALSLAKQLSLLGATAQARAVLERTIVVNSLNQTALAELLRIDSETGNRAKLAENLPRYLAMRKPSRPLLEEILLRLDQSTDAPLREELREAIKRASASPAP